MKQLKKLGKGIVILAGLLIALPLYYKAADFFLPIDFSQDYRRIQGAENIVFCSNYEKNYYKRCFWGLKRIENLKAELPDTGHESDASINELSNLIHTKNTIRQSVYSPDRKYILFCELEYRHTVTDDEDCYYRVYEIETGRITTIYQAHKEWYNLHWTGN